MSFLIVLGRVAGGRKSKTKKTAQSTLDKKKTEGKKGTRGGFFPGRCGGGRRLLLPPTGDQEGHYEKEGNWGGKENQADIVTVRGGEEPGRRTIFSRSTQ